jgi:hypothetical protein
VEIAAILGRHGDHLHVPANDARIPTHRDTGETGATCGEGGVPPRLPYAVEVVAIRSQKSAGCGREGGRYDRLLASRYFRSLKCVRPLNELFRMRVTSDMGLRRGISGRRRL